MAAQNQTDLFDAYFRKADLDGDGQISGAEAVAFFQGSNLPKHVLAQVWMYADQKKLGYLGRQEFYNALKLVTVAQSKRELTPDIVKAALYGHASAKIPAPQINIAATPAAQPKVATVPSQASGNASVPSQNFGLKGAPGLGNVGVNQQYVQPLQSQVARPSQTMPPSTASQTQVALPAEGMLRGSNMVAPSCLPTSNSSTNWQSGSGFPTGVSNQVHNRSGSPSTSQGFGLTASALTSSMQPRPQATPVQISSTAPNLKDSSIPSSQSGADNPKALVVSGNGFASDSLFGDVFSATSLQSKQISLATTSSATSSTVSTSVPASGSHPPAKSSPAEPLQGTLSQQSLGGQYHPGHPTGRQYQQVAVQSNAAPGSSGFPTGPGNLASGQSTQTQPPWPKMTQSDIQKYTKVFVQVDADRDGKITGDQARNLFLSWRLPRGFQQPQASSAPRPPLPSARGRPPRPGPVPQTDAQPLPTQQKSKVEELEKEIQDSRAKTEFFRAKMQELILYKSRCDNRLNEITERASADKREVEGLSKKYEEKYRLSGDVASRLTIEESTFRDIQEKKMELYKAIVKLEQGDNKDGALQDRANHIQSSLEELVKSVNERCKQYGLRAKPTSLVELPFGTSLSEIISAVPVPLFPYLLEMNTRNDGWQPGIQEGTADWDEDWDKFEDEGFTFVKELTLDVQNVIAPPKPKSSLVQKETAADANSDKVPDTSERIPEKDFAVDHSEDGVAKSSSGNPAVTTDTQSQEFQDSHVTSSGGEGSPHAQKASDPYESPRAKKTGDNDSSALAKESRSDQGGAKSLFSEDKGFDEPSWGKFDSQHTDAIWGFDSERGTEMDPERHDDNSIFGLGGFNIKPIKTQSSQSENLFPGKGPLFADSVPSTPAYAGDMFQGKSSSVFGESVPSTPAYADNMFQGKGSSVFADSVPSTPAYADSMFKGKSSSLFADSVPSTPAYADNLFKGQGSSIFGDSVPSTPAYADNLFKGKGSSIFADSVPSTPAYADNMFKGKSSSIFADSVPSTPAYHYGSSQQGFGEGSDGYSFDSFPRSDSFNMQDGGLFQSRTFDRFDSMHSSTDFDQGYGFPPLRFDSFNASDQPESGLNKSPRHSLTRFDSMRSTTGFDHGHEFSSFDDADPFGSTGPFRTSLESQTPRRDANKWSAF
ncbi:hypothetical protein GOBAR_DD15155 [Gossypium barbadense]|nr:hypothetical protein GOBAR_DD15155 [Gossypium barbadense]